MPFVVTDPLPAIRVRLNATEDATFLIDTGAPDIVLSDVLAKRLGVKVEAAGMGTFGGGKQAAVSKTSVKSIALGSATAYDVSARPSYRFPRSSRTRRSTASSAPDCSSGSWPRSTIRGGN